VTLGVRLRERIERDASRVLLVRHAQPSGEEGRCYGHTDLELSHAGERQAADLAACLAASPISTIVSSPLIRARATADPLARQLSMPVKCDDRLKEIHFGAWEGERYDELAARFKASYLEWLRDPTGFRFPGGESWAEFSARVVEVASDIQRSCLGGVIVVVAHGGVIRTLLARALGMPREHLFRLACDHAHISWIDVSRGTSIVQGTNLPPRAFA